MDATEKLIHVYELMLVGDGDEIPQEVFDNYADDGGGDDGD